MVRRGWRSPLRAALPHTGSVVLQPEVGSARAYRGGLAGGGQAARGEFVIALKAEAGDEIVWISSEAPTLLEQL